MNDEIQSQELSDEILEQVVGGYILVYPHHRVHLPIVYYPDPIVINPGGPIILEPPKDPPGVAQPL